MRRAIPFLCPTGVRKTLVHERPQLSASALNRPPARACLLALIIHQYSPRPTSTLLRRVLNNNLISKQVAPQMKFRPLQDRVLIRRIEQEDKTAGGIIIPDTAKEKPQEGEIIAVGPGGRDESGKLTPLDVKSGDKILFGKWSGTEVKIDGQDLLIMKESDILGVVA